MPARDALIEIFRGPRVDPRLFEFGQKTFLVAVYESGDEDSGAIIWGGDAYEDAREVARQLAEESHSWIVDMAGS